MYIMDCECLIPTPVTQDGINYCSVCFVMDTGFEFDEALSTSRPTKFKSRIAKFHEILCRSGVDWKVRNDLMEFFPRVERYFLETSRVNFFNLYQLAREMCRVLGYQESIGLFPPLKTLSRVKQIRRFMDDCCVYYGKGLTPVSLDTVRPIGSPTYIPDPRVISSVHIYSDLSNIYDKKAKDSTKTKKLPTKN